MGSLPNLHELGKDEPSLRIGGHTVVQHHYGPSHSSMSNEERNRVFHRHSAHCKTPKSKCSVTQGAKIIYDDFMLEQMAAYSPISSRSTRNLTHNVKRRDSMNSSIGATSVRRLLAVVRNTGSKSGPNYSRKMLIRNLTVLCMTHILISSTFFPFLALQSSVSVWNLPLENSIIPITINVGSFLLTTLFFFSAIFTLIGPSVVQNMGTNAVFLISYAGFAFFYGSHLYPVLYLLIPVYILMGVLLGCVSVARITFLMTVSTKISYVLHEDDEDAKIMRRTIVIRRVARAFQAAQDFGLILGSVLSAILITYTINLNNVGYAPGYSDNSTIVKNQSDILPCNQTTWNCTACVQPKPPCTACHCTLCDPRNAPNCSLELPLTSQAGVYDYSAFLDDIFDVDEFGDRLCGSQACPSKFLLTYNASDETYFHVLPKNTANILACWYIGVCVVAFLISGLCLDKIRLFVYQDPLERPEGLAALRAVKESFRDVRLQLAAPLAFFIGLEQAFMYADFSKSYVVCTLGIHRLNLVFLCMGLLQSVAACTLSMLLRTIRRYYVIAVGFTFHACLLMVQLLWKPINDDPALFYVISAAWGVCNAVWEMLSFTLLTGLYADNWEAPFSNSIFFRYLGMSIAFFSHSMICNWIKLYLLAVCMLVAVVPFAWLEIRLENIRKVKNISRL